MSDEIIIIEDKAFIKKEEIVGAFIDDNDKKKIVVWVKGGFIYTNTYDSEDRCKGNFLVLRSIFANNIEKPDAAPEAQEPANEG